VRLAADRGLEAAIPALRAIHADPDADPFLREAAWDALARLDEPPRPFPMPDLPPLLATLAEVPASAHLVVVVDQTRVPRWPGLSALGRRFGVATARDLIEMLGSAVTWRDRASGQLSATRSSEMAYELARRHGNARLYRGVAAFGFGDGIRIWTHWEGRFETDAFRRRLEEDRALLAKAGVEIEAKDGAITIRDERHRLRLTVTPGSLRLVVGDGDAPPGGEVLATELGFAGATQGHPVWAHLRRPLPGDHGPLPDGLLRGTAVVDFDRGIRLSVDARFAKEAAARAAVKALEPLGRHRELPEPLASFHERFEVRGSRVTGRIEIEAASPTDALRKLLPRGR
jgi:hypothetical protein